jgi:hypothetical protein
MSFAVVASLSLSSLAFELLITRYFSIAHWSHLSFFAIGVAMLGFAAGGTFHSLAAGRLRKAALRDESGLFAGFAMAGGLCTIGSFLAVKSIPLDYLRLPLEAAQAAYLFLTCLLLSLPFFFAGLASCAAYARKPARSGTISFVSMLGSVAGALVPLLLLPLLGEGPAIAAAAAVPLLPAAALPGPVLRRMSAAVLTAGLAAFIAWQGAGILSVTPSPYKGLPQLLQAPGAVVIGRSTGIRGRLDEVESPFLRFAPGLSLGYEEELPRQRAAFEDGDSMSTLYDLSVPGSEGFARWTHAYASYIVAGEGGTALVIQRDGGLALVCALASRAQRITVVIEDPRIAGLVSRWYRSPSIAVIAESPRSFLGAGSQRYDTIAVEEWGPSLPGMASLSEDGLLTSQAIQACWGRLTDRGVLAIARRIVLPPSDSLRIFATCFDLLSTEGIDDPAQHLAVIRSWDSCTLLVCRAPLGRDALARLRQFAEARGFDLDYFPGITPGDSGRFNRYERPVFTEAFLALVGDPKFAAGYPLDIMPQSDDRPFPSHFVRLSRLGEFFAATGQRMYTLLLSGEVVAAVTLLEALAVGILLVVPAFLARRGRRPGHAPGRAPFLLLAAAAGLGFMFAEMFVVDSLSLAFPAPTVALTAALGGLLVFSAFGGLASERLTPNALRRLVPVIAVCLAACALFIPRVSQLAIPLPFVPRSAIFLLLAAVPGFLIGIPFPAALRLLGQDSRTRAAAWALSGCTSAAAAISSALIAPAAGIRMLLLLSAAAYAVAAGAAAAGVAAALRPGGTGLPACHDVRWCDAPATGCIPAAR